MNRKEIYAQIVKLNLQAKVVEKYGKNYTNCKTEDLKAIVVNTTKKVVKKTTCCSDKKMKALLDILQKKHLLLASEIETIVNA